MTEKYALKIVRDNYYLDNDSFLFYLHECDLFRADRFNTLCRAVEALAHSRCELLTQQITHCYQNILKEFIYHFNPNDSSQITDFPKKYTHYLEKFDCALAEYYACGSDHNEKER
jgi:hypothetical protein